MIEINNTLFEDKDGNIWICTTSGFVYFNPGKTIFVEPLLMKEMTKENTAIRQTQFFN